MSAAQPWLDDAEVGSAPWDRDMEVGALERSVPAAPHGIINAIISGFESSATGLAVRGEMPSQQLPGDSTTVERVAAGIASVVVDLPLSVAGAVGLGTAGTAVAPGVGTVIGTGAGAVAAPMAVREALMTAYQQGGVHSWSDAWEVTQSALKGTLKGVVIGGLTAGAGRAVGVATATSNVAVRMAARPAAEVATLVTAGSALEGRMPTAQDFVDAAIVVGGIRASLATAAGLRNLYARTGVHPAEVALDTKRDPAIAKELAADPTKVPKAYEAKAIDESVKAAVPEAADRATAARFAQHPFEALPQTKGEPTRPTHVNYNYINGEAELSGALSKLSTLYEKQIQTARRGKVPMAQTIAESQRELADALGVAAHKLPAEAGIPQAKLGARLLAKRQMAVDAAQELRVQGKALADLGANASEAQVAQFLAHSERASMILADFLGLRAEVGRAQQALKATVGPSTDLAAVQKLLAGYGGKDKAMDFARIIGDADSPAAALKAAQALVKPGLLEKGIEVWKASILSGPTTHLANLLGNTAALLAKVPERTVAVALGKLHGGEKMAVAEARAFVQGTIHGSLDALKLSGRQARNAILLKAETVDPTKVEQYRNAVGGKAGEVVRLPFKALSISDTLFRTLNERGEAFALATRQAVKDGHAPGTREFNSRVADLVQNPTPEMAAAVKYAGEKATFTNKLGKTGTHLQMAVKGTPLEFVLPFIKTPINLLKWAAEYMPGVNLLLESVRADLSGKNGAIARDLAVSRMVIGTATMWAVVEGVDSGTITGGGLADPEKRAAKSVAGWQPYSLKIGDTYYSYQRIDPIARVLSVAADAAELYHVADDNEKLNLAAAIVSAAGNATVSQTYLAGLANAINAVTDPGRYGGRWLDQYAASLIPGAVGQTAVAMDPEMREVNSILDAMQARIPVLREQLLSRKNPLTGEPMPATDRVFPFAPVTTKEQSEDKVLTEAARLGVRLPSAPRNIQAGRGAGKAGKVKISPEARNAFTQEQGRFAHDILSRIVNTPAWDNIPDLIKSSVYERILSAARVQAALVALPPEARAVEAQRIAEEMADQLRSTGVSSPRD